MRPLPDYPLPEVRPAAAASPAARRAVPVLAAACAGAAIAVAAAFVLAAGAPAVEREPGLEALLRLMAGVKALMLGVALVVLGWRARRPLPARLAAIYVAACAVAAGAVVLIAQLVHVGPAALAFHAAEAAFLLAAWRDGRAAARR